MTAPIQVLQPRFRIEECLEAIRECLEAGWTGIGFKTVAFEKTWCDYTGLPHAHFLGSATFGLHLALEVLKRRLGWQPGDEVIGTPLTFVSSNHAVLHAGLTPVFADVDDGLCLDPEAIEARIGPRTRAVVFVGLGGNTGAWDRVVALCRARGLALILDAAHMAGTRHHGRHVGHDADAAVFSFQAVKNLPTADSGMICFAGAADDAHARRLSWMGIDKDTYARTAPDGAYRWRYEVAEAGFKYHGNSIMAAIALVQLRYLEADNQRRREMAAIYRRLLDGAPGLRWVDPAPDCLSSTHLVQIRVPERDRILAALAADGIHAGVHYRDNTDYALYADQAGTCPRAQAASAELISLPLHLGLADDDLARVAARLRHHLG